MKLSKLALSNSRFKWPVLVITVAVLTYMTYWFICFSTSLFSHFF